MLEKKAPTGSAVKGSPGDPYRVLVVDDSAVIRGLLSRVLETDPDITIATTAANGKLALGALSRHDVEVVVLDIEMPEMDGLTALPKIIEMDPDIQVIMASTLTLRNADISLKALSLGAADYIPKPTSTGKITGGFDFKRDLVEKVKALGAARRASSRRPRPRPAISGPTAAMAKSAAARRLYGGAKIILRPAPTITPRVLAIGSSTGGPQALFDLLPTLGAEVSQPIVITQHMPATFTTILAEHIARVTGRECVEGSDGAVLSRGHIYIAPGDYHMTVERAAAGVVLRLNQDPPENFCRPAVDPMLRSMAKVYGREVLAVILTGMGKDGQSGGRAVVEAGGSIIAQDEASSVVWGMPGAVATAGLCSAVLPLDQIGPAVRRLAMRAAA